MSEIHAKQARDITNHRDEWNVELWYSKYKDYLFNEIKMAALNGHDHLALPSSSWNNDTFKANYLDKRLSALGYNVHLRTDLNEIVLSW
jgi:hypothetical protein